MKKCWFDYKTVIVSGASSGIGKGLVVRLVKDHGCNVIGIARNEQRLLGLKEELGSLGYKFSYYTFDVSLKEKWAEFAKTLEEEGIQPDILINNAGILPKFDRFENYTLEEVDKAMQINFYSCVYSMNELMPIIMRSENAGIVNVASSAALCSLAGTSVYSASKAALKSFTDAVREEHRDKCYFGLVCPGFTKTDIFSGQGEHAGTANKAIDMVSTACDSMVNKIVNGIAHKRDLMVFGIDAKLMGGGNRLFAVQTSKLSSKVMEMSKLPLFEETFKN